MAKWLIQVQAQFEVEAVTLDEACDEAVNQAMDTDACEWGTIVQGVRGDAAAKRKK